MNSQSKNEKALAFWKARAEQNELAYQPHLSKMKQREKQYRGENRLRRLVADDIKGSTVHVRNLTSEMIESQIDSNIPQPKVTPRRPQDEEKAKLIEDMLRNELNRMPFERFNDSMERTVPIQGGGFFLVEWDNEAGTHSTAGELKVSFLHPSQVIPQNGVYTDIEDMDYIILKLPQTCESIERRYGIQLNQDDADAQGNGETAVIYRAYYRGDDQTIGVFSWVGDTILEDDPDYQARHFEICSACGAAAIQDGVCNVCGEQQTLQSISDIEPFASPSFDHPEIPLYRPGMFPIILQKNVSLYGAFLGDSDTDKIADQQNTANRIEAKIIDKLMKSGSYITLPPDADIEVSAEDMKVIRLSGPAGKQMMGVYDMQGNIEQDAAYLEQLYQEARQTIGITESMQGRQDTTATSGKAKEFAAAQSAGRLESKRVMKNTAYAALFEAMFKFKLAYMDEARPIPSHDRAGNPEFKVFDRMDFLETDDAGAFYWNDAFLFSCDSSAPLASNREAMWNETASFLQSGAFGNPAELDTLILFWKKMELLHYPGAGETRTLLEEKQSLEASAEYVSASGQPPHTGTETMLQSKLI